MRKKSNKNAPDLSAFAPNPFDPLGMYGCYPAIINFGETEELETPTQDVDDL
ncbi:MAG: hypothetical protein SPI46_05970 [Eubacteriales bacterium]|nr:hypothetical protein [Eubacteriales bacterium]